MSIYGSSDKALADGSESSEMLLVDSNQDGLDMRDTLRESVVDQGKEENLGPTGRQQAPDASCRGAYQFHL